MTEPYIEFAAERLAEHARSVEVDGTPSQVGMTGKEALGVRETLLGVGARVDALTNKIKAMDASASRFGGRLKQAEQRERALARENERLRQRIAQMDATLRSHGFRPLEANELTEHK